MILGFVSGGKVNAFFEGKNLIAIICAEDFCVKEGWLPIDYTGNNVLSIKAILA